MLKIRSLNNRGLEIIKKWEGLRLNAYLCPSGKWTIGWGHTKTARAGMVIDLAIAERLLNSDLDFFEAGVEAAVKVALTENQFSALVSFAFNCGLAALERSTLLRLLNQGKIIEAAAQFDRWVKDSSGNDLEGLKSRRKDEKELFLLSDAGSVKELPRVVRSENRIIKSLRFEMALKPSKALLWGKLIALDADKKGIVSLVATSGCAGYQTPAHFKTRGKGCCPPAPELLVQTRPVFLPNVKGVEGNFFPLGNYSNGSVYHINGYGRADIGIHFDANVPGSAGCIVIENRNSFDRLSRLIADSGVEYLPIEVKY